jgi:threonine/homoserine/homoserine lactone efflux protein
VGGRRGGVLTAAGVAAGQLVWTVAASVGIASLLQASQPAFTALKIVGAAYLAFLGVQSILAALRGRPDAEEHHIRPPEPLSAIRQGFISNLANPKMAVFFLSLLPQFVRDPSGGFAALVPLGAVFCLMTFGWLSTYAVVLDRVGPFLQRARIRRAFDAVTGTVLVAFGIRLAAATR